MDVINRVLSAVCRIVAWIGMVFLLGAMGVTSTDIILRHINNQGIFGAVDIVQLMIMGAAFLSIPYGFISNGHVSVSIIADRFGRRMNAFAKLVSAILATGFMTAIAWFGYEQALMQIEYGDMSLTLGIPKVYYWIPLLAGSALSGVVCVYLALEALIGVIAGRSDITPNTASEGK